MGNETAISWTGATFNPCNLDQPASREVFRFVRHRGTAVDLALALNARGFDAEIWLIGGGRESRQRFAKGQSAPTVGLS